VFVTYPSEVVMYLNSVVTTAQGWNMV
jgi:hypothetical protein